MESENRTSLSHPPKFSPKPKPSASEESDENADLSQDKTRMKFQNLRKQEAKHFMSPTMATASKAAVPRKKILADRNEASNFPDAHLPKPSDPEPRASLDKLKTDNLDRSSFEHVSSGHFASNLEDEEEKRFTAQSTLKPYDPFTNYLSPRPKYLRYQPNRRREFFADQESRGNEEKDNDVGNRTNTSFHSLEQQGVDQEDLQGNQNGSSSNPIQEGFSELENEQAPQEGDDDEEEEDEEEPEEGKWGLKRALKFLVLLAFLIIGSLYSLSGKTPTLSSAQQVLWDYRNGYYKIHGNLFEAIMEEHYGGKCLNHHYQMETHSKTVAADTGEIDDDSEGLDMKGNFPKVLERVDNIEDELHLANVAENINGDNGQDDHLKLENGEGILGEPSEVRTDMIEDNGDLDLEKDITGLESVFLVNETLEQNESSEEDQATNVYVQRIKAVEDSHIADREASQQLIESEMEIHDETFSTAENGAEMDHDRPVSTTSMIKYLDIRSETINFLGISASLAILCWLVSKLYRFKNARSSTTNAEPAWPPEDLNKEEICTPAISREQINIPAISKEEVAEQIEERTRSHERRVSSSHMGSVKEESSKQVTQVYAPKVELLGELVFEVSSSLRSCGSRKSRALNESAEESIHLLSDEKVSHYSNPVPDQNRLPIVEASTADSPSLGSFTAEEKIIKKEGARDMVAITTPVRRSSRIRSRAAMSP